VPASRTRPAPEPGDATSTRPARAIRQRVSRAIRRRISVHVGALDLPPTGNCASAATICGNDADHSIALRDHSRASSFRSPVADAMDAESD
jgi:hypothetical protein